MQNAKTPRMGKKIQEERSKKDPIKLTNMVRAEANNIPVIICLKLPLTSLGEASIAPKVTTTPACRAPSFIPTITGMVSAIPNRIAFKKSVLLKKEISLLTAKV